MSFCLAPEYINHTPKTTIAKGTIMKPNASAEAGKENSTVRSCQIMIITPAIILPDLA